MPIFTDYHQPLPRDLTKVSTRNAWAAVAHATELVRSGLLDTRLNRWFQNRSIDPERAIFPCVCRFDEDVYLGTVVDQDGKVWEYLAGLTRHSQSSLENVTASLGPKALDHPDADLRDLITMALYFHRQESR